MSRRKKVLTFTFGGIAVLAAAAFAVYWFVLRSDAPDPVSLDEAVAAVSTTAAGGSAGSGIEGLWTSGGDSFVGYRVDEELASIGFTTAAGRTSELSATLTIAANLVTEVAIEADLTALQSDKSSRDRALRRQALETDTFPTATFVLTEPIDLPDGAASGEAIAVTGRGDLTLHGVTRSIEVPLEAQLVESVIVVIGSTDIVFADYDIDKPTAGGVLSVEDRGIMEFRLLFERG